MLLQRTKDNKAAIDHGRQLVASSSQARGDSDLRTVAAIVLLAELLIAAEEASEAQKFLVEAETLLLDETVPQTTESSQLREKSQSLLDQIDQENTNPNELED